MCWSNGEFPDGRVAPNVTNLDFAVRLGIFTLFSNERFFELTDCTLGLQCILLMGAGNGNLAVENSVRIWTEDKCGQGSDWDPMNNTALNPPLDLIASTIFPDNALPYNRYFLGTPRVRATANFTLCWTENPTGDEAYHLEKGTFFLNGPDRLNGILVCTLGLPCSFQLTGRGLESINRVRILAASARCGDQVGIPYHFTGLYEHVRPAVAGYALSNSELERFFF